VKAWARQHPRAVGIGITASALAILGIAVLVGWAMVSGLPATAQASPSSDTSANTPSNIPTTAPGSPLATYLATPTATAPMNWPPPVDAVLPNYSPFFWAVSAVNKLNVRSGPGTEHPVVAQLNAGDLVLVTAPGAIGGWNGILGDGFLGFVSSGPEDHPYLQATQTRWESNSASLRGIASDDSAYLAWGTSLELEYLPWEAGQNFLLLRSENGLTWTRAERDVSGGISAIVGSQEGWVRLTYHYPDVSLVSYSQDGQTWEASQWLVGNALAYGPAGWVVVGGSTARSTDGRTWSEPISFDAGAPAPERIEASEAGYVAFVRCTPCSVGTPNQPIAWGSRDGVAWAAIDFPADGAAWVSDVELIGDRLLVLTTDSASGESTLHHGRLTDSGSVTWEAPPGRVDVAGLRVDSISQGPNGLLALGWDSGALVPAAWRSTDGASWERLDLPRDALGGSVGPEPAWGSAGWVGLGTSVDGARQQLWQSADGESWEPAGDPVGYTTPVPPCPPAEKVSTLMLTYLGPLAERCLGNASLTIRGWVSQLEGWGGCCSSGPVPAWLASNPTSMILPAAADEVEQARGLLVYVPPDVDDSALQQATWVEVVGHFRDAAAATCAYIPLSDYPGRLESLKAAQLGCQQRFVVESVTAVDGP
jgi:hypothetical protein